MHLLVRPCPGHPVDMPVSPSFSLRFPYQAPLPVGDPFSWGCISNTNQSIQSPHINPQDHYPPAPDTLGPAQAPRDSRCVLESTQSVQTQDVKPACSPPFFMLQKRHRRFWPTVLPPSALTCPGTSLHGPVWCGEPCPHGNAEE